MKEETAHEVIHCLPRGKTHFRYFKDHCALVSLSWAAAERRTVHTLRRGKFAQLLDKPAVRALLAESGSHMLNADTFRGHWRESSLPFLLTPDTWRRDSKYRRCDQTSRRRVNLVLQLNFTNKHRAPYQKLVKPKVTNYLDCSMHPVLKPNQREFYRDTLAWARIDLDFDSDEALIEELQTDWVRHAEWHLAPILRCHRRPCCRRRCVGGGWQDIALYLGVILPPYRAIWCEEMLTATLIFVREELGIRNIFYHTPSTRAALKNIEFGDRRVRSMSQLPRRFCFRVTDESSEFLRKKRLAKHPNKCKQYR